MFCAARSSRKAWHGNRQLLSRTSRNNRESLVDTEKPRERVSMPSCCKRLHGRYKERSVSPWVRCSNGAVLTGVRALPASCRLSRVRHRTWNSQPPPVQVTESFQGRQAFDHPRIANVTTVQRQCQTTEMCHGGQVRNPSVAHRIKTEAEAQLAKLPEAQ